jgi:hypothetical protein
MVIMWVNLITKKVDFIKIAHFIVRLKDFFVISFEIILLIT